MKIKPIEMGVWPGKEYKPDQSIPDEDAILEESECCHVWTQKATSTGSHVHVLDGYQVVRGTLRCDLCGVWTHFPLANLVEVQRLSEESK